MKTVDGDVIYSFKGDMDYIAKVRPGETFKVKTYDCFFNQIKDESQEFSYIDDSTINPATGPIFIEGAQPGDLLKVEILDIHIGKTGVALVAPGDGVLGDKLEKSRTILMEVKDDYIEFGKLSLPIKPMIGVIGVAPSKKEGDWGTETPWKHGGNMDTKDIAPGSTLYLPINQVGGLLALGDCHGIMGDGEVSTTGCEIDAEVTLKVDVIKDKKITWPLLETEDYTMVIASGDNLDDALYNANVEVVRYLEMALDIPWEEAYILSSLVVDFRISQVVNPKVTVRGVIPKSILETGRFIDS